MAPRYVIVHAEMGLYLGCAMGFGFFSLLDTAGQTSACTFDSPEDASHHIAHWQDNNDPKDYRFVPVETGKVTYAAIPVLIAAGLEREVAPMIAELSASDTMQ